MTGWQARSRQLQPRDRAMEAALSPAPTLTVGVELGDLAGASRPLLPIGCANDGILGAAADHNAVDEQRYADREEQVDPTRPLQQQGGDGPENQQCKCRDHSEIHLALRELTRGVP